MTTKPITEAFVNELDKSSGNGDMFVVVDDDGDRFVVMRDDGRAAEWRGVPGDSRWFGEGRWFDADDHYADPMRLWQHCQYATALHRIGEQVLPE